MGRTIPCIQADSSVPGRDQTGVLPGEEKLVSQDVLKLYHREEVVQQEPADVDPDRWVNEGELTELPEISVGERERVFMETRLDSVNPEIITEPDLEILMILDDPEEMAERERDQ